MKIRCKIRRKAGSSVTLGGTTYRWHDDNDHVCEVENQAHIDRLLDVPSAFAEESECAAQAEAPSRRGGRRAARVETARQ